jgi:hypothetical protein
MRTKAIAWGGWYARGECGFLRRSILPSYMPSSRLQLRPGIINSALWYPDRPDKAAWEAVRRTILKRDDFTCQYCGHRALKGMHLHHLSVTDDNSPGNLATICVACHAVMHLGRSMAYGSLAVYQVRGLTQVEILQRTRSLVAGGPGGDQQELQPHERELPTRFHQIRQ